MTAQAGPQTADGRGVEPQDFAASEDVLLRPGATVGEYIVEKQIGEGGMGVIFSARQPVIDKRVAIKVLNAALAANGAMAQRFIQEARSVNQIRHRNIVDIFSFGRLADGRHYFVMEFLDGMPFSKQLANPIEWQPAVATWLQVAAAVSAAHERGIVHRDLKPDNIYIIPESDGPFVKVLDFGIAKLLGETSAQKTGTGVPMGTPLYMSPEQTRGEGVDHRTDLYAFGCILYETMVGISPFHAPSYVEVMTKQLTENAPPLRGRTEVNPALEALVMGLLAKDPEARPQSMEIVRKELIRLRDLAVQHGQPLFVRPGTVPGPVSTGLPPDAAAPTTPWRPARDDAFTMPEARDSSERHTVTGGQVNAPRRPGALVWIAAAGLVAALLAGVQVIVRMRPSSADSTPHPAATALPSTPAAGHIKVIATESGISVSLDGELVGEGGPVVQVEAKPGRHDLKVTRPGFLTYSTQLVVAAGETTDDVVKLVPVPVEAPKPTPRTTSASHGEKRAHPDKPVQPTVQVPRDRDGTINAFGQ